MFSVMEFDLYFFDLSFCIKQEMHYLQEYWSREISVKIASILDFFLHWENLRKYNTNFLRLSHGFQMLTT